MQSIYTSIECHQRFVMRLIPLRDFNAVEVSSKLVDVENLIKIIISSSILLS